MQSSRSFELKIKQAEKYKREHPEFDIENSIADSFCHIFNGPEDMGSEVYNYFFADREKLFFLIDLYNNEADEEDAKLLSAEEWRMLVELTNRFASDLDLHDLQELMQFFLNIDVLEKPE